MHSLPIPPQPPASIDAAPHGDAAAHGEVVAYSDSSRLFPTTLLLLDRYTLSRDDIT